MTLAIDQSTHLPSRVLSMAANPNMGDVAIVTTFSDYEDVDGVKLPRRSTTMMDEYLQFDLQIAKNTLNGNVPDIAAPASVISSCSRTMCGRLRASPMCWRTAKS